MSDVLQSLQAGSGIKIQCLAQDPAYTKTDKKLLQDAGITVLKDPRALMEVSDESVVKIVFRAYIPVRPIVTDSARPAITICDKVKGEQELLDDLAKRFDVSRTWASVEQLEGWLCDPESPRLRGLIKRRYEETGKLDDDNFAEARIYVRRPDTSRPN